MMNGMRLSTKTTTKKEWLTTPQVPRIAQPRADSVRLYRLAVLVRSRTTAVEQFTAAQTRDISLTGSHGHSVFSPARLLAGCRSNARVLDDSRIQGDNASPQRLCYLTEPARQSSYAVAPRIRSVSGMSPNAQVADSCDYCQTWSPDDETFHLASPATVISEASKSFRYMPFTIWQASIRPVRCRDK